MSLSYGDDGLDNKYGDSSSTIRRPPSDPYSRFKRKSTGSIHEGKEIWLPLHEDSSLPHITSPPRGPYYTSSTSSTSSTSYYPPPYSTSSSSSAFSPSSSFPSTSTTTTTTSTTFPSPPSSPLPLRQESKNITNAAAHITRQAEYDEKRVTILDKLSTFNNGRYHYDEKRRLLETRFIPIPQAILDQYEQLQCKSFLGLLPAINRAFITIDNKLFLWNYHDGKTFTEYSKLGQIIVSLALLKPRPGVFFQNIKFILVLATPVEIVMLGMAFQGDNVYGHLTLYETEFCLASDNVQMLKIIGTPNGRILMAGNDGCVYELHYQAQDGWFSKKCRKLNHTSTRVRTLLPSFLWPGNDPIVDMIFDWDRPQKCLFALSSSNGNNNIIQAFSLGGDGEGMALLHRHTRILSECQTELRKDSRERLSPEWQEEKNFHIINIFIVPPSESDRIVLVAVTRHGHRIFFSLDRPQGFTDTISGIVYPQLRVRFVRLCPPSVFKPDRKTQTTIYTGVSVHQPSFEPLYQPQSSPAAVHLGVYSEGVMILADSRSEAEDTLVVIDRDEHISRLNQKLHEAVESLAGHMGSTSSGRGGGGGGGLLGIRSPPIYSGVIPELKSRICDLTEMSREFYLTRDPIASCLFAKNGTRPLDGLTDFATQHAVPPRTFLMLSSSGVHYFKKQRPKDELRDLLKQRLESRDETFIQSFFEKYGIAEVIGMCFLLACSDQDSPDPAFAPYSPFENYSTVKGINLLASPLGERDVKARGIMTSVHPLAPHAPIADDIIKRAATQILFTYGTDRTELPVVGRSFSPSQSFSAFHEGLALYISRLLRPVWNWSIVRPSVGPSSTSKLEGVPRDLRFSKLQILAIQTPIARLLRFLTKHREQINEFLINLTKKSTTTTTTQKLRTGGEVLRSPTIGRGGGGGVGGGGTTTGTGITEADERARNSLHALFGLLSLCDEILSLLQIISEESNFSRIAARLNQTQITELKRQKFYELVTATQGQEIVRSLIDSFLFITLQSPDQDLQQDRVNKLFRQCPTYFGKSDLLHYRAASWIEQARNQWSNQQQRNLLLRQALDCYRTFASSSSFNIQDVCQKLRAVHYYAGAVELALFRMQLIEAREVVPEKTLFADFSTDTSSNLTSEFILSEKEKCLACILSALDTLVFNRFRLPEAGGVRLEDSEGDLMREKAFNMCLESKDQKFHNELYAWLLENYLKGNSYCKSRLLKVPAHYLVPFLTKDEQLTHLLLLKEFYLNNEMYEDVTILLCDLSYKRTSDYDLNQRLHFLSRALICAQKCVESHRSYFSRRGEKAPQIDVDMIHRIKERIAIAKIQKNIQKALSGKLIKEESKESKEKTEEAEKAEQGIRDAIDNLDRQLFDIDELLKYSSEFGLWELMLEIINFSQQPNAHDVVVLLYKNIIHNEINLARKVNQDWGIRVRDKINELKEHYKNVPALFPQDDINRIIERCASQY